MKCLNCGSELTLEQQVKMLQKQVEELEKKVDNMSIEPILRRQKIYYDNPLFPPVVTIS